MDNIFVALATQTVTVPGTEAAELVIPQLAANIKALKAQRDTVAGQVEDILKNSLPPKAWIEYAGIGIKTAAQILLSIGDESDFASHGHRAAYAGITPVKQRSGSSIRGKFPSRTGNKRLKNALFYSAFVAIRSHETSRTYYGHKRAEGKRHNAPTHVPSQTQMQRHLRHVKNKEFYRETLSKQTVAV